MEHAKEIGLITALLIILPGITLLFYICTVAQHPIAKFYSCLWTSIGFVVAASGYRRAIIIYYALIIIHALAVIAVTKHLASQLV